MATPIQGVLKPPPAKASTTISVAAAQHTSSTAALASAPVPATQVSAPTIASGPSQFVPSVKNSLTIINPTDGKLVYIGQDGGLNSQSGHALYPGNSLVITGYNGPVWSLSSNGPATLFYTST